MSAIKRGVSPSSFQDEHFLRTPTLEETDEPLAPGEPDVAVPVRLRISWLPVPGGGRGSKRLTLA